MDMREVFLGDLIVMKEILKEEVALIEQTLKSYFQQRKNMAAKYGPILLGFYENIREYIMRGGKRLRPVLIAVSYKAIRERAELENLYLAALGLEFLHNGSLLHDDLIDHDETRRGRPTFHVTYRNWYLKNIDEKREKAEDFGMAMAILGGDALTNMGAQMFTSAELPAEVGMKCLGYYQYGFQQLIDGVLLELSMVSSKGVTPELYLQMIYMKTAALFEMALAIGATMAGASESQINALRTFGKKVGQAFQVQDDILGTFGDEKVLGKPTDSDIREGKKTMLVIQTYNMGTKEHHRVLDTLLGKSEVTHEELERVKAAIRESGALTASQELMNQLLQEGQQALDRAEPPLIPKYKQFLIEISNFLVKRNY